MKYRVDVKVIGFSVITVEADSGEEAEEKASEAVMQYQVSDLRWKETLCIFQEEPES